MPREPRADHPRRDRRDRRWLGRRRFPRRAADTQSGGGPRRFGMTNPSRPTHDRLLGPTRPVRRTAALQASPASGLRRFRPSRLRRARLFRTDDPEPVDFEHGKLTLFTLGTHIPGITTAVLPAFEAELRRAPQPATARDRPFWGFGSEGRPRLYLPPPISSLAPNIGSSRRGDDDWYPQVGVFHLLKSRPAIRKFGFQHRP